LKRLNLKKKLNDVQFKEQYQVKISNRCAALEEMWTSGRAWESIKREYESFSHRGSRLS
jgi:hypothetical protein